MSKRGAAGNPEIRRSNSCEMERDDRGDCTSERTKIAGKAASTQAHKCQHKHDAYPTYVTTPAHARIVGQPYSALQAPLAFFISCFLRPLTSGHGKWRAGEGEERERETRSEPSMVRLRQSTILPAILVPELAAAGPAVDEAAGADPSASITSKASACHEEGGNAPFMSSHAPPHRLLHNRLPLNEC